MRSPVFTNSGTCTTAPVSSVAGFVTFETVSVALLAGMLAAMIPGIFLFARYGKKARKMGIPFGPFLALGSVVALFWGHDILDAYLSTLH